MKSGIYIIRNLINNKVYVGKSKNVKQRKNAHFSALKLNKHNNQHLQLKNVQLKMPQQHF